MTTRIPRRDLVALHTATRQNFLSDGQAFYETPKAFEIWEETPILRRVKRFPKSSVLFTLDQERKAWMST